MKVTIVEGTEAEILRFLEAQAGQSPPGPAADSSAIIAPAIDGRAYVSADVAHKALTRRELAPPQRQILIALYRAHPDAVSAVALQKMLGWSTSQFAGIMGAFGNRVSHTKGYRAGQWFFDQEWNGEEGCNYYRLPDSVREAMRRAKLV